MSMQWSVLQVESLLRCSQFLNWRRGSLSSGDPCGLGPWAGLGRADGMASGLASVPSPEQRRWATQVRAPSSPMAVQESPGVVSGCLHVRPEPPWVDRKVLVPPPTMSKTSSVP